jgi:hypothetical protein
MFRETIEAFRNVKLVKLTAVFSLASLASAGPILFERDLPVNGINLSGASRSNIAPVQGTLSGTPYVLGDDFTLSGTGSFIVTSMTVWIVGNCPVTTCTPTNATPASEFNSISLYVGPDNGTNGPVFPVSSLSGVALTAASTHVTYSGGQDYLSPNNGLSYPIFQITFSSLGLVLAGNHLYDFAVSGAPTR